MTDRVLCYAGEQVTEDDILQTNKFALRADSAIAQALFEVCNDSESPVIFAGFRLLPSGLTAAVQNGAVFLYEVMDSTAYSSLGTDATTLVKSGIYVSKDILSFPAPGTTGQSINYLIQVKVVDDDVGSAVLPYYNSANLSQPLAGPNNNGSAQATIRETKAIVGLKAGAAATTGTQTTPSPDAGYNGLWVVTIAHGQSSININTNVATYGSTSVFDIGLGRLRNNIKNVVTSGSQTWAPLTSDTMLLSAINNLIGQGMEAPFTSIASAATTDLGSVGSSNVTVTGTTTITSFGSSANVAFPLYIVKFAGVLTLTNGANLKLPSNANITTAANDVLTAQYLGSGQWQVLVYWSGAMPATGTFTSIASAATTDLASGSTQNVNVTGTTTITSFGSSASTSSPLYVVKFASALTLTTSGNLAIPGGVNLTVQPGDYIWANYLGSGSWDVIAYFPNNTSQAFASIASASTTDLGSTRAVNVNVTGTTTITSFGSSASTFDPIYFVTFAGSLVLTQGANINLPYNQNITTAAGDYCICRYKGSGQWDVLAYFQNSSFNLQPLTPILLFSDTSSTPPLDPGSGQNSSYMYVISNSANWRTYDLSSHIPASANAKVAVLSCYGRTTQNPISIQARQTSGQPIVEFFQIEAQGSGDDVAFRTNARVPLTNDRKIDLILVGGPNSGTWKVAVSLVGYE